jgi:cytochrome c5
LDARPPEDTVDNNRHYQRQERFKEIGVINDPSCTAATKPDDYGLWLDKCDKDPNAVGIMGARKFPNPDFDPAKWDVAQYYASGEGKAQIEPPYRVGISCGVCHIAYDPRKPPKDTENPKWENIASAIGNQYLLEGALFGGTIPDDDFRKQVLNYQPPGTSDTSRIATDHIDNPNAINAIFNLADRPRTLEVMNDGKTEAVPHVLKDGADSVGVALASERVYINIGSCGDYWLTLHDPLLGRKAQKPFDIETARKDCEFWSKTEARMPDAEAFLTTLTPMYLADAPGGKAYLTQDQEVLTKGKKIFADTCATCHSSKKPPAEIAVDPEKAKQWYQESVLSSDFLDHNFLSDDQRKPVTEIGTNAARALATNAKQGNVWAQFSSKTYKELPSPGKLTLENPFDEDKPIDFEIPAGGTGYYRTPSLISIWSSAPFFHNNSLGKYNADPSVAGRMEAFNDAAEKLLSPEKRDRLIKRTDRDTHLELGSLKADVPKGTPIKLLANLDPRETPRILQQKLNSELGGKVLSSLVKLVPDDVLAPLLLKNNKIPDFIEDHGHEFGKDLADEDKHALIEFLKTF